MRGMILAAGRGKRMKELTANMPKPLLRVGGKYLIEHSIDILKSLGVIDVVINISWLGEKIQLALGDGSSYGMNFTYSLESEPLETGGGIFNALPYLGSDPFVVISSDILFAKIFKIPELNISDLAHILLVPNPDFKLEGDFSIKKNRVMPKNTNSFTYANIAVLSPRLFDSCKLGCFALGDLLKNAATKNKLSGQIYYDGWLNVGTPELLKEANSFFSCKLSQ